MRDLQKRDVARELRSNMTDAERRLWHCLRLRQLAGHRFRRQCPVGPYIADFACLERRLIVELDGGQHAGSAQDRCRDAYLYRCGFRVLRFWNNLVFDNLEGVLSEIDRALR
ncbi:MAG TPA: endonuclease domain-containing protein [Lysobacter sp.]|jgi:very-short-patch-repair endonuclease|nr:endonuclease domain-containing protein [Lysobacter sp.]